MNIIDLFIHFLEQRLVVCLECRHTVLPSNIDTYLKDKDTYNILTEDQKHIIKEVWKIKGLIQNKSVLNSLSFPLANNPPITALQTTRDDSMKCQLQDDQGKPCHYITCQLQKI